MSSVGGSYVVKVGDVSKTIDLVSNVECNVSFGCLDGTYFKYHTKTKNFLGIYIIKIHNSKRNNV